MSSIYMTKDTDPKGFEFADVGGTKTFTIVRSTMDKTFSFQLGLLGGVVLPTPVQDGMYLTIDIDKTLGTALPNDNVRVGSFTASVGNNSITYSSAFTASCSIVLIDFGKGCRDPKSLTVNGFEVESLKAGTVWYIAVANN